MKNRNRWIVGSALTVAAVLAAVDHTRHPVPAAAANTPIIGGKTNPCALGKPQAPCALRASGNAAKN